MPKKDNPYNLTDQQINFAKEYVKLGGSNACQAAKNANYSDNYAKVSSHKLLEIVSPYLKDLMKPENEEFQVTKETQRLKLNEAYEIAKEDRNPNAMTKVIEVENKMYGVNEPDEMKHSGKVEVENVTFK